MVAIKADLLGKIGKRRQSTLRLAGHLFHRNPVHPRLVEAAPAAASTRSNDLRLRACTGGFRTAMGSSILAGEPDDAVATI